MANGNGRLGTRGKAISMPGTEGAAGNVGNAGIGIPGRLGRLGNTGNAIGMPGTLGGVGNVGSAGIAGNGIGGRPGSGGMSEGNPQLMRPSRAHWR
jgi:hypothetical protein